MRRRRGCSNAASVSSWRAHLQCHVHIVAAANGGGGAEFITLMFHDNEHIKLSTVAFSLSLSWYPCRSSWILLLSCSACHQRRQRYVEDKRNKSNCDYANNHKATVDSKGHTRGRSTPNGGGDGGDGDDVDGDEGVAGLGRGVIPWRILRIFSWFNWGDKKFVNLKLRTIYLVTTFSIFSIVCWFA